MPKPTLVKKPAPAQHMQLVVQGKRLVSPLEAEVQSLIIDSDEAYEAADVLLADITKAEKEWKAKIDPILKPLREAKSAADALNLDVAGPLKRFRESVTSLMAGWKRDELIRNRIAQKELDDARAAAARKLEEAATREATARTKPQLQKAQAQVDAAALAVEEAEAIEAPVATTVEHSSSRIVKRWQVTNIAEFCMGVAEGTIPSELVAVDVNSISTKADSPAIANKWPGLELVEDVVIVRRGR